GTDTAIAAHPAGPPAYLYAARGVAGPRRPDGCRQRLSELPCREARRLVVPRAWDARQPRHSPGPTRRRPRPRDPPTRRGDRGVPQQSAHGGGGGGLRYPRPGREQAPGGESRHCTDPPWEGLQGPPGPWRLGWGAWSHFSLILWRVASRSARWRCGPAVR